ncbi:LytR/AlgR family response regulator transcription factor [Anaeromicropila populeti]|uniref:Stage 0 sporulation protein A homolog n=1 Tax=Anaeromicropila populeti TaxID=37658 RepID=A0A1I6K9X1_9FIRM|nr:LytTR family DNA-binding domain-containing protein [Anaeromicropila populeti]SFR87944.1 two component transcriptional regulator, LytTR family [Anaeromicropila populeti]
MLTIAICDDNTIELEMIEHILDGWAKKNEIKKLLFTSGDSLLNYCIVSENQVDILLLDVQMKDMDGLETAQKLRSFNKECIIIFITNYSSMVYEAYKVKAFRYVLKKQLRDGMLEALDAAKLELNDKDIFFECNIQKRIVRIFCRDILYFESNKRIIEVHLRDNIKKFYGRIYLLSKELDEHKFIRCHQSFIVHTDYVHMVEQNHIILRNEYGRIPISERYRKNVEKALLWMER